MENKMRIDFGLRLMKMMEDRGMSQADLCRLANLTTSMISHYCAGQRLPKLPAALAIAEALNTSVEYLASGISPSINRIYAVAEEAIPYSHKKPDPEPDEQSLALLFQLLNPEGKAKVLAYIEELLSKSE